MDAYADNVFAPGDLNTRVATNYGLTPAQLALINDAYKAQYGSNIGVNALMRAASEAQGLYLWGPPASGGAIPPGATVANPNASAVYDSGISKGGIFTPSAEAAARGVQTIGPNTSITAPLVHSPIEPFVGPSSPAGFLQTPSGGGTAGSTYTIPELGSGGGINVGGVGGTGSWDTLLGRQDAQQQQLFDKYSTTIKNQEALPTLYSRLSTELGIPGLNTTVQGYKDQINQVQKLLGNLTGDVASRTSGTFTTQAQLNRQIAAEGDPLRTQLANLGYGMAPAAGLLSTAQGQLGTQMTLATQQQAKELTPLEMQINAQSDKFAREITGFTEQRQEQLTLLMDKLQRDRTLSDREWQAAQDLAASERDFQRQKELAQMQINANKDIANISASATVNPGISFPTNIDTGSSGGGSSSGPSQIDWNNLLNTGNTSSGGGGLQQSIAPVLQGGGGNSWQWGGGTLSAGW